MWQALLTRLEHKPSFAWLDYFTLASLGEEVVTLSPAEGQRGLMSLVNDRRRQAIEQELARILGRSVRVKVTQPGEASEPGATAGETGQASSQSGGASQTSGGARQEAMNMPLVRELLEQFPNATLTDVKTENADLTPPDSTSTEGTSDNTSDAEP